MHRQLDSLLVAIKDDLEQYFRHEKAGMFSDMRWTSEKSMDDNHSSWWRNLIDVLVSLPYPENYHYKLIDEFRKHGFDAAVLEKFRKEFLLQRRAIWWYSQTSYFYGVLNQALRRRNVQVLLLFGSFLQDLHRQLKSAHWKQKQQLEIPVITVYRGQALSRDDLDTLEVGFPVRCNSLFSSSTDRDMALGFLLSSPIERGLERVLFEIEVDYRKVCPPFADISQLSYYGNEQETLFMSTVRFQLGSRHEEVDLDAESSTSYWLMKLKLLSDDDIHSIRELEVPNSARKTVKNCIDALSEIVEMVPVEDVNLVCHILADLYPREQQWFNASKLYCMAKLEFENNNDDYCKVVEYHERAIATLQSYCVHDEELDGYFNVAQSYFALGELFGYSVENQKALSIDYWEKALHFYELALSKSIAVLTDYSRVNIITQLVSVCQNLSRNADLINYGKKAIAYQKEWMKLMLLMNPTQSTSLDIARGFGKLADMYAGIHQYDDALSNYEKAVDLYLLNENNEIKGHIRFREPINLTREMVTICTEHVQDVALNLKYNLLQHEWKLKEAAHDVGRTSLWGTNDRFLAESHFAVADCYIDTQQYVEAYKHLLDGLKHARLSKELLLQHGLTLVWSGNRPSLVALAEDDERLIDCKRRIDEIEVKLTVIELLLAIP